jgi:ABC-type branched-subunit amino acid transport system ATPase component
VVDRDLQALSGLADRYLILDKGQIARAGPASDLLEQRDLIERYLGLS